jgi:hypothetical protein
VSTSLIVAIAGVVIAAAALGWTIYRDHEHSKALADESKERRAADEREEKRHDERLGILQADFLASRQAQLVAARLAC